MPVENTFDIRRGEILGIEIPFQTIHVTPFADITAKQIEQLLSLSLMGPDDSCEEAPSVADFLDFMNLHPKVRAHGYVVSQARQDHRVTIEGLEFSEPASTEEKLEFVLFCRYADELSETRSRWW